MNNIKVQRIGIVVSVSVIIIGGFWVWRSLENNRRVEESKNETVGLSRSTETINIPQESSENVEDNERTDITREEGEETNDSMMTEIPGQEIIQQPIEDAPIQRVVGNGNLQGVGQYQISGNFNIVRENNRVVIQFSDNFSFSGAPDPVVYLTRNPDQRSIESTLVLGQLQKDSGTQAYEVSVEEFEQYKGSIMIWCRAFEVYMGGGNIVSV